jgi:hypothetical protein
MTALVVMRLPASARSALTVAAAFVLLPLLGAPPQPSMEGAKTLSSARLPGGESIMEAIHRRLANDTDPHPTTAAQRGGGARRRWHQHT